MTREGSPELKLPDLAKRINLITVVSKHTYGIAMVTTFWDCTPEKMKELAVQAEHLRKDADEMQRRSNVEGWKVRRQRSGT